MWARVVEIILAVWLFYTVWAFEYADQEIVFWIGDLISAVLIAAFALISFWRPYQKAHLGSLVVGLWLWGVGYRSYPLDSSSIEMNAVSVGLLVLMVAVVPSHSHELSASWAKFIPKQSVDPTFSRK